jgi:two-component system heavy metal sensor histidine kinase CusS
MVEFYEPLIEEKKQQLTLHGNAEVDGDRLMLRRAVSNLLSNAIRHTPEHGFINVALEIEDEKVKVRIENSGDTIPPEHLPRLFDRFYRVDSSRQRAGEGSGLGLAITKSIALAHNGNVSVSSTEGVTSFSLWLPARKS